MLKQEEIRFSMKAGEQSSDLRQQRRLYVAWDFDRDTAVTVSRPWMPASQAENDCLAFPNQTLGGEYL